MNGSNSNKIAAACLVLAGGKGRRLTPDKPLLEINNRPIIELFPERERTASEAAGDDGRTEWRQNRISRNSLEKKWLVQKHII
jgi:CTP:molybdopterin cytidylyltransferase MocA